MIVIDSKVEDTLHVGNSIDEKVTFNGSVVKGVVLPPIIKSKLFDQATPNDIDLTAAGGHPECKVKTVGLSKIVGGVI